MPKPNPENTALPPTVKAVVCPSGEGRVVVATGLSEEQRETVARQAAARLRAMRMEDAEADPQLERLWQDAQAIGAALGGQMEQAAEQREKRRDNMPRPEEE